MTTISTDSCGNESATESYELIKKTLNTFTHPYIKTCDYNNVNNIEINKYKRLDILINNNYQKFYAFWL